MTKRLIYLLALLPLAVFGATHNATSWSQFETMVESTASDGDTVTLAAGTYTMSSSVTVPSGKKITMQGAGSGSTRVNGSGSTAMTLFSAGGSGVTGTQALGSDAKGSGLSSVGM